MKSKVALLIVGFCFSLIVAGCGGGGGGGSTASLSETVTAASGVATVSAATNASKSVIVDDSAGSGVTVEFPAGTLSQDTTVTIENITPGQGGAPAQVSGTFAGAARKITLSNSLPTGKSVNVSLPKPSEAQAGDGVALFKVVDNVWTFTGTTGTLGSGGTVTFSVNGFSMLAAVIPDIGGAWSGTFSGQSSGTMTGTVDQNERTIQINLNGTSNDCGAISSTTNGTIAGSDWSFSTSGNLTTALCGTLTLNISGQLNLSTKNFTGTWTVTNGVSTLSSGEFEVTGGGGGSSSSSGMTLTSPANGAAGVSSRPTFNWVGVPNVEGYQLVVMTNEGAFIMTDTMERGENNSEDKEDISPFAYPKPYLLNGTYQWKMRTFTGTAPADTEDCANCNEWSATWTFTVGSGSGSLTCGNGTIESGENCDDSNTVTETCPYGETSCTVCDSSCDSVSGATSYCGDSITDAGNGETCDAGENNGQPDECNATCNGTTVVDTETETVTAASGVATVSAATNASKSVIVDDSAGSGVTIEFPAGTLSQDTTVTIENITPGQGGVPAQVSGTFAGDAKQITLDNSVPSGKSVYVSLPKPAAAQEGDGVALFKVVDNAWAYSGITGILGSGNTIKYTVSGFSMLAALIPDLNGDWTGTFSGTSNGTIAGTIDQNTGTVQIVIDGTSNDCGAISSTTNGTITRSDWSFATTGPLSTALCGDLSLNNSGSFNISTGQYTGTWTVTSGGSTLSAGSFTVNPE